MSESGGCCRCCCSFIFTLGLTSLFMWLSLRTSNPTCSIQKFDLLALNRSSNSSRNTTIYFQVKLDNGNKDKGIYYDNVNLTFYYTQNMTYPMGNFTIPAFYQGHNKKAKKGGNFTPEGQDWEAVFKKVNGTAVFRVDLATKVRFKIMAWKTKRHHIKVEGNVTVNDKGAKEGKKGVKLKSGARENGRRYELRGILVIISLLILNI